MLSYAWYLFINGGWLIFSVFLVYFLYRSYMREIGNHFLSKGDPILLQIKVERTNLQSTLAVEQIFAQLHAIHTAISTAEKYLEGKDQWSIALEIVSIGGKISYFVYTPRRYQGLVESAFYARYPSAEIVEVEDYMKPLNPWSPDKTYDVWGTEFKMLKDVGFPIRTYKDFEHSSAEEKIIDPLAGLIEALSRAGEHELMAYQICLKPIADNDWSPKALAMSKKLKKEFIQGEVSEDEEEQQKRGGAMTPGERRIIEAIENKTSKPAWEAKIRLMHIGPKTNFDGSKKGLMIGGLRHFTDPNTNGFKPDTSLIWTSHNYIFFRGLEQPYMDFKSEAKKTRFIEAYSDRSMWLGLPSMILNIEELATLFHFPINASALQSTVENVAVKKGQPPSDLPVM
jgi:hypothetical protein